jgi:hypothetical protein
MKAFFQHLAYSFIRNALNGVSVRDKRLYAGAVRYSGTNIHRKIRFIDVSTSAFSATNPMFGYQGSYGRKIYDLTCTFHPGWNP